MAFKMVGGGEHLRRTYLGREGGTTPGMTYNLRSHSQVCLGVCIGAESLGIYFLSCGALQRRENMLAGGMRTSHYHRHLESARRFSCCLPGALDPRWHEHWAGVAPLPLEGVWCQWLSVSWNPLTSSEKCASHKHTVRESPLTVPFREC